jgi:hypothetical protein
MTKLVVLRAFIEVLNDDGLATSETASKNNDNSAGLEAKKRKKERE